MDSYNLYNDIQKRTDGEIYIGVVGPVRTGKSTFIKRFMEMLVIPGISDEYSKMSAKDELPQSSGGRIIMTTEPKFIPKEAVEVTVANDINFKVRMIDCVGYMVDGAEGHEEDGKERLVKTPWYDYDIPFTKAAEIGTKKVINNHSTVGIVVTSDGSVTDIPIDSYIDAQNKTISELKAIGKPFIVLLNSNHPKDSATIKLADEMSVQYDTTVVPVNCDQLKKNDIDIIFESLLMDFPISSVNFNIPKWVEAMDNDNMIKLSLIDKAKEIFARMEHIRDIYNVELSNSEYIEKVSIDSISMADGNVNIMFNIFDKFYYTMLSDLLNCEINNEYDFVKEVKQLSETKSQCSKVSSALEASFKTGYGTVTPEQIDIKLEEPELIKSGNKYGVKIKAQAPSIHLIKANITTEIAPIVGSEEQAKDLIRYIKEDNQSDPENIWDVNIFGKSIKQLVDEGMSNKVNKINQESQAKLQDTMEKIVNDSNGGLVCIII